MIRLSIVVFLFGLSAVSSIQTFYMDMHCGQVLDFSSGDLHQIRLEYTSNSTYESNTNCVFYLVTGTSERFMLYFMSIETYSCSHAYLDIYGNNTNIPVPGLSRKCGTYTETSSVYTTGRNALTLNFVSDAFVLVDKGFDMIITSYHTGSCHSDEYECDNERCIHDSLKCNDYNPCGDSSDCDMFVGAITWVGIGCVVFSVIFLIVTVKCILRRGRGYSIATVGETTAIGSKGHKGYN